MNTGSAHLLVFHGSRDRQYGAKISQLGWLVTQQLGSNSTAIADSKLQIATINNVPLVEVATLEFADLPLCDKIVAFAQIAIAKKYPRLTIVPVFLSAGVHVREDIPHEMALARQKLQNKIVLESLDFIGNASFTALIEGKFASIAADNRILLAHGSRLPQGNVRSEQLARRVRAKIAYWTIQPDLTSVVQLLAEQNRATMAIVPYFLFSGRITEAIASLVAQLQDRFPNTQLNLTQPLGATPELAEVIATHIMACNEG